MGAVGKATSTHLVVLVVVVDRQLQCLHLISAAEPEVGHDGSVEYILEHNVSVGMNDKLQYKSLLQIHFHPRHLTYFHAKACVLQVETCSIIHSFH